MAKKTIADVPPGVASEFKRTVRPDAVADATATGYATTAPMARAQLPGKSSKQFGLPKSGAVKAMKMKG
jgi:hypothetical protein